MSKDRRFVNFKKNKKLEIEDYFIFICEVSKLEKQQKKIVRI